ncbi:MAG: ribosomal protein S18-alanine N-acetyltransferase [Xanthomonadales bacterium]|nr:Ribosomal-protein-alanine acetyltransferase [Xanthomonadales bacterium]MCC6594536.1 ribosomal protein S18-alanine N-acetyltransferase [Xanthomonadales bacterium]MCE7931814.1 ribosomal-protein-alanine N-acetyltransferase [Xanthomonadales bacterium PRO6]
MSAQPRPAVPHLRPMRLDDLPEVLAIEAFAYEFPWTDAVFRDCFRAGYGLWVLEGAPGVLGYGVLSAAAGEAHILNLCVAPGYQNQGHGRRLLHRLVDLARWHQAERVFLEVRPSNRAAITLYRRNGFCEIGQRPNYYPARNGREDAIVMARELLENPFERR